MNYYNVNLELLKKTSKMLYRQITIEKPINDLQLEKTEDGSAYIMKRNNNTVNMHSLYDVEYEMKKMFLTKEGNEKTIILFGLGEGHALKYIKKNLPCVEKVLVVEPSLQWYRIFLENHSLMEYVKGLSVSFLVNRSSEFIGNEVGKYINDSHTKMIYHLSYRVIFKEYYDSMMLAIKNNVIMKMGNYSFRRSSLDAVTMNFVHNMKYGYLDSEVIEDILKNKPLLVVAAGPSLDKNMHLINRLKDKAVVVAVGSAIKILDSNGIIPHFRMAFDPFLAEKKVVDSLVVKDVPLIFSYNLFIEILPNYEGPKIAVDIGSDHGKAYLNHKWGKKKKNIQSASSIAISAVDMGVKYGSSKIIIIGFDAAFSPDKLYADGVGETRAEEISRKLKQPGIYESEDIYGNKVLTTKGFYMNKIGLEIVIKGNPSKLFIDATEGGLPVEGSVIKTLQEVIDEDLLEKFNIEGKLKFEDLGYSADEFRNRQRDMLSVMIEEIDEVERINNSRIKRLKKLKKYHESSIKTQFIVRELEGFKEYDESLKKVDLYQWLILNNLKSHFDAVADATRYNGFDIHTKNAKKIEKYLKISGELHRYCLFFRNILQLELEGKLYDAIIQK